MDIANIRTIFFSPTGTSKKIVQAIAEGARASQPVKHLDLTSPTHPTKVSIADDELAIIAVPVYAGRVASLAVERLREISGNNSPAIIVVLYGNRDFDDALIELKDIMTAQAFNVIAACTFIGEHSYSSETMPTAQGRPDANDLTVAKEFGKRIMQHLLSDQPLESLDVPGDTPYKDGMPNLPFTPAVDTEQCTQCEECISVCPTGAISLNGKIQINVDSCIFCCACLKVCPVECISLASTPMEEKAVWLNANCSVRKEPQLFL